MNHPGIPLILVYQHVLVMPSPTAYTHTTLVTVTVLYQLALDNGNAKANTAESA